MKKVFDVFFFNVTFSAVTRFSHSALGLLLFPYKSFISSGTAKRREENRIDFEGFSCCCRAREQSDHKVVAVSKGGPGDGSELCCFVDGGKYCLSALCRAVAHLQSSFRPVF